MKLRIKIAALLLVSLLCFPDRLMAEEATPTQVIWHDAVAGYMLTLPPDWREAGDRRRVEELARRVCAVFIQGDTIPRAIHMRAAEFPDDTTASPALVVFALNYNALGLDRKAAQNVAQDSKSVVIALANALQQAYKQVFPYSIMINHHLGDDFFSLNLRSAPDKPEKDSETTRNQHLKLMLTSEGALILMTLYDGPPLAAYDSPIAAAVRSLLILPEKSL
ncbi:MAG: hypothetical protein FWG04_01315 [Desulfovibrionaceae bacterium]|nr:hypothetical protein [Desulfovibrionaceae bacterium]